MGSGNAYEGSNVTPIAIALACEVALHRLHADPRERLAINPYGASVQRAVLAHWLKAHDETIEPVDPFRSAQPISIAVVEAQLQWQRQHLLGLQQRKGRAVRSPL